MIMIMMAGHSKFFTLRPDTGDRTLGHASD